MHHFYPIPVSTIETGIFKAKIKDGTELVYLVSCLVLAAC